MNKTSSVNNKKIFKNTVALYARMLLSMIVSLYTSRIVLNALGVDDYGIYGLVGGIVVLFSFLNVTMSGATSRFLTVELAKNDPRQLQQTFNTAFILHIGIAIIVLFLAETVGLWLLFEKLNIPDERMSAAVWVYQFSIISSMVSITQVPYNATLISHEKMDVYAIVEIVGSLLKLLIATLLLITVCDKLILYGGLMLLSSFLIAMTYRIYCIRHYDECRINWEWNKVIGRSLFSFSGWNLYSNICFTTRQQGTNMLLNIFGSTAVNAAAGLATTVQLMIEQVSTNLVMASRPQIIKQYALTDFNAMIQLLKQTTCLANVLYLLVAIPFISEIHYVMNLWLVEVPPYTIEFCILLIVSSFISLNNNIIYIGMQAVGRLKFYSFMAGTVSLSVIPILWLLFSKGIGLTWAFGLPIVSTLLIYIVCSYTLHHYVEDFKPIRFFFTTMVVNLFISIPSFTAILLIQHILVESFTRVIIVALSSSIILVVLSYYVLLDKENKKKVKALILNKLKR